MKRFTIKVARAGLALTGLVLAIMVASVGAWRRRPPTLTASSGLEMMGKVIAEWRFDHEGDLEGWQPNAHLADVQVKGGVLSFRGVGADPILEFRPLLDIPASPWQVIEIRLKADKDGTAEFFWSNTTQTRYGGFSPGKETMFTVIGDGQWRTYRILPFWHPEGKIVRLRFDPYDGANFAVDFIRIVGLEQSAKGVGQRVQDWQPIGETQVTADKDGLTVNLQAPDAFLLSPPLQVDAETQTFVSVRMAATQGKTAMLFFASEQVHGLHSFSFPIVADGKEHTYTIVLNSPYLSVKLGVCTRARVADRLEGHNNSGI